MRKLLAVHTQIVARLQSMAALSVSLHAKPSRRSSQALTSPPLLAAAADAQNKCDSYLHRHQNRAASSPQNAQNTPLQPPLTDPPLLKLKHVELRHLMQAAADTARNLACKAQSRDHIQNLRTQIVKEAEIAGLQAVQAGANAATTLTLEMEEARLQRKVEQERLRKAVEAAAAAERKAALEVEKAAAKAKAEAEGAAIAAAQAEAEAQKRVQESTPLGVGTNGDSRLKENEIGATAPPCSTDTASVATGDAGASSASPGAATDVALPSSAIPGASGLSVSDSSSTGTTVACLSAEWKEAVDTVGKMKAARPKASEAQPLRRIESLVGQTSRVLSVVHEKAQAILHELASLRGNHGESAVVAGCYAMAGKLLAQGMLIAERSSANAYPLALLALSVGTHEVALWQALRNTFSAACPYVIPFYVPCPSGSGKSEKDISAWKRLLGYAERAGGKGFETKEQYFNRMSGIISLWSVILQAQRIPILQGESMDLRPAKNGLGTAEAWRWLARLLNQAPQRITSTILLAMLKPSAYALGMIYPRQFSKLLRFTKTDYCAKMDGIVAASTGPSGRGAEERAAMALLQNWLQDTLTSIDSGQGLQAPGDEAALPDFKEPDDTREAGEEW